MAVRQRKTKLDKKGLLGYGGYASEGLGAAGVEVYTHFGVKFGLQRDDLAAPPRGTEQFGEPEAREEYDAC